MGWAIDPNPKCFMDLYGLTSDVIKHGRWQLTSIDNPPFSIIFMEVVMGKSSVNGGFSIATFGYRRISPFVSLTLARNRTCLYCGIFWRCFVEFKNPLAPGFYQVLPY
jgi:hypothetical protein